MIPFLLSLLFTLVFSIVSGVLPTVFFLVWGIYLFFTSVMPTMSAAGTVALWVLFALVMAVFLLFLLPNALIGYVVYTMQLKRTKKTKWTRECSANAPDQIAMYNQGVAWGEAHAHCKTEVHIVSEGLNLYGEFFDFGSEKTCIVVGGRTEGLRYCYFFARPYQESGYNILVIDNRAHGESDGLYNTVGFEEHKDLLNWANYLHENHHTDSIVFHGICIGCAGSLYALLSEKCPDYIHGIVAEGMFPNFRESFRNHMIELKKPMFGLPFIDAWMILLTGHSMKKGPIDVIDRLDRPILMICGREDHYSTPEYSEKMFDKCGSQVKQIVWFDHGAHSKLRYTDPEKYDGAIKAFLAQNMAHVA